MTHKFASYHTHIIGVSRKNMICVLMFLVYHTAFILLVFPQILGFHTPQNLCNEHRHHFFSADISSSGTMSVASSLFSSISGYIPTAVKEAAGLSPQISEAVRRFSWNADREGWKTFFKSPLYNASYSCRLVIDCYRKL